MFLQRLLLSSWAPQDFRRGWLCAPLVTALLLGEPEGLAEKGSISGSLIHVLIAAVIVNEALQGLTEILGAF